MSLVIALTGTRGEFTLDVDLELASHGVTAVFGASGAGKTTLLRAVAGLDALPGRVILGEETWQDSSSGTTLPVSRRGAGFVFQGGGLFDHLTVDGNLDYGANRRHGRSPRIDRSAVISLLGLAGLTRRLPEQLSAGQRQRVAIGRALLAAPKLLLLDEPLANLDLPARQEILSALETLSRRTEVSAALPILYVTHSWAEVERLADHVVRLTDGRVSTVGSPAEVAPDIDPGGDWEAEVGVVLETVVEGHRSEDRLTELSFAGGTLLVPRCDVAVGERRRVRLLARDVSLTIERASETSILNILPARVVQVRRRDSSQPLVVLDVAGHTLLARVTYRSMVALELSPERRVWAQIKGVALIP